MRTCYKCKIDKPDAEYGPKTNGYCRECGRETRRAWRARNPDNVEKDKIQCRIATRKRRARAIEILGGKCVSCGIEDIRVLEIDHIHNDGNVERKNGRRGKGVVDVIGSEFPWKRFQLLCSNCHSIKTWHRMWKEG